jgi:hypothetical protein
VQSPQLNQAILELVVQHDFPTLGEQALVAALKDTSMPVNLSVFKAWLTHYNSFKYLTVPLSRFSEQVKQPSAAEIKAYFDAHQDQFQTLPKQQFSYVLVNPDPKNKLTAKNRSVAISQLIDTLNGMIENSPQTLPVTLPKNSSALIKDASLVKKTTDLMSKGEYKFPFNQKKVLKVMRQSNALLQSGSVMPPVQVSLSKNAPVMLMVFRLAASRPAKLKPINSVRSDIVKLIKQQREQQLADAYSQQLLKAVKAKNTKKADQLLSKYNVQWSQYSNKGELTDFLLLGYKAWTIGDSDWSFASVWPKDKTKLSSNIFEKAMTVNYLEGAGDFPIIDNGVVSHVVIKLEPTLMQPVNQLVHSNRDSYIKSLSDFQSSNEWVALLSRLREIAVTGGHIKINKNASS